MVSGTSVVRPLVSAALAADAWINSAIAEPDLQESMGEYATAAEVEGEAEDAEPEEEDDAAPWPDFVPRWLLSRGRLRHSLLLLGAASAAWAG